MILVFLLKIASKQFHWFLNFNQISEIHQSSLIIDRPVDSNPDYKDEEGDHEDTEDCKENRDEEINTVWKLFCLNGVNQPLLRPSG